MENKSGPDEEPNALSIPYVFGMSTGPEFLQRLAKAGIQIGNEYTNGLTVRKSSRHRTKTVT